MEIVLEESRGGDMGGDLEGRRADEKEEIDSVHGIQFSLDTEVGTTINHSVLGVKA